MVINSTCDLRAHLLEEENELWQLDRDANWPEKFVGNLNFANEESTPANYNVPKDVFDYDDYFLSVGIRESLKCSKSKGLSTPESDIQGFQVSLEGEGTSAHGSSVESSSLCTHSFKIANDENSGNEQYCGLDALAEACKTVDNQF